MVGPGCQHNRGETKQKVYSGAGPLYSPLFSLLKMKNCTASCYNYVTMRGQ